MAVTAANQTFRKAVLPVLSELDIHLNLPDQEISEESGIAAAAIFNFNNPTWFVSGETTLLEDVPADSSVSCALASSISQNSPFSENQIPPLSGNVVYQSNFAPNSAKGTKRIGGLGGSASLYGTIPTNGQKKRWNYILLLNVEVVGRTDTISGSSFHKFKFISANPANPQTLVYDIVA